MSANLMSAACSNPDHKRTTRLSIFFQPGIAIASYAKVSRNLQMCLRRLPTDLVDKASQRVYCGRVNIGNDDLELRRRQVMAEYCVLPFHSVGIELPSERHETCEGCAT